MRKNGAAGGRGAMSGMVRAVLRRNRAQVFALAVTYTLTFALLVLLQFFYPSVEKTFDRYLEEYRLPEATVLMSFTPRSSAEEALKEEGIRAYSLQITADLMTRFPGGKTVSCRWCSVPEAGGGRWYSVTDKKDAAADGKSVMISSYFARHNGVGPGDTLTLITDFGRRELTVTDVVSSPETISTNRDAFSWYDSNDFAYIFVGERLINETLPVGDYCNRISMWFEEGTDAEEALSRVTRRLGGAVTYAGVFEGSDTQKQIRDALEGTRAIVTYMPGMMIAMGVLFSTLFFIQIVNRGEKQNGLLLAIGYDPRRISRIYVRCSVRLTLISAAFGFALGAGLLRMMLQIYVSTYDLPFVCYDGSLWSLPVLLAVIIAIGVASSLLSCLRLGKLDPARIFSGAGMELKGDPPGWISRLRTNAFVKMSLCGIWRSRGRFCLSVLCSAACLVLTFVSLSVIASKRESVRYLFGDRFRCDLAVKCDSAAALDRVISLPGAAKAEKITEMSLAYEGETVILQALPESPEMTGIMSTEGKSLQVPQEGILLEEGFARRHRLGVGDRMTLGGAELTVKGITREYYDSIQYISFGTAAALGSGEANMALLTLAEGQDAAEFAASAAGVKGYLYHYDRESRKNCVESVLSTLDIPCYVLALFSAVIGAVIVSTMNLVSIAQRRKKYASLYVLGTTGREFLGMELPEAALQLAATMLIGTAPAIALTKILFREMSMPSQEFVAVHPFGTALASAAAVAAYLAVGVLVSLAAIRKMKYLEVLSEK